jgi:serine protease
VSLIKTLGAFVLIITLAVGAGAMANSGSLSAVEATQSQDLVDSALVQPENSQRPNSITLKLRSNGEAADVQAAAATLGGQLVRDHQRSGLQVFSFPNAPAATNAIQALSHNPNVEDVSTTLTASVFETPDDTFFGYQWHLHDTAGGLRAEPAWDLATSKGSGVVVAVIDTGVAYESFSRPSSPGLPAMNFQQAPDLTGLNITDPFNYVYDDTHANDDHSHGSHVTGTIAQTTNNAYGMAGVASNVTIMPIKVLDYGGSGIDADLVDAIYYAVDNGAHVISMSLGFTGTGSPDANGIYCTEIVDLNAALDYAYSHGVVVVAASGNEGASNVSCPAAYPTVISVGASTYAAAVASYSNQGDALDVVAPGGDPGADLNGDGYSDGVLQETYCNPGAYIIFLGIITGTANFDSFCAVFMSGTSMATPHVTGVVALLLGQDPSLSPNGVRSIIEGTARDGGPEGWDTAFGYGIVDAAAALAALTGAPTPTPTASATVTPTATPSPTATPGPTEDTVSVTKASYNNGKDLLKVEATSSASPDAVLTVYDNSDPSSPLELGVMSYNSRRNMYSASFILPAKPSEILVISSEGGQDTYSP